MSHQWTDYRTHNPRKRNRYTFWQVYPAFVRVAFAILGAVLRGKRIDIGYHRLLFRILNAGRIDLALWETASREALR